MMVKSGSGRKHLGSVSPGRLCRCSYHVAVRECSSGIFSTPPKQAAHSGYLGTAVAPGGALHPTKVEVTELEEFR